MSKNKILKEPIAILANGSFPKKKEPLEILNNVCTLICTDGSANTLIAKNLSPQVIIGDMDSINNKFQFKGLKIPDYNKNNTDLEKAIEWLIMSKIYKVTLLGATGNRDDMSLVNYFLLFKYFNEIDITMITDFFSISCNLGKKSFNSFKGQTVSILPKKNSIVSSKGLKFTLNNERISQDGKTLSNLSNGKSFSINCDEPILIFRSHT